MRSCPLWLRQAVAERLVRVGEGFDHCAESCFDRFSWFAGPVLVCVGFLLTISLSLIGLALVVPVQFSEENQLFADIFVGIGVANIFIRYLFAVFTNPGTPTSAAYARLTRMRGRTREEEDDGEDKPVHPLLKWTKCRVTGLSKPPRSHYDTVNAQLVMGFDHWCPWIFNSVGYANYRHFVWLLVWVWALTLAGVLLTLDLVLIKFKSYVPVLSAEMDLIILAEFAVCLGLNLAVGFLLSWHVYLLLSGQTSVDYLILRSRRKRERFPGFENPFDTGSAWENMRNGLLSEGNRLGWLEAIIPPNPKSFPLGKPFPGAEW